MPPADAIRGRSIPPEQLIALNDEIAALVRAGVPLELGLREMADDTDASLKRISSELADRMSRGESLAQALAAEGSRYPAAYRAIVEAGLKAGRLPAALEAVSDLTARMIDFRRRIGLAAIYPLIVAGLAYGLFLLFLAEMVTRYESAFATFRLPLTGLLSFFVLLRDRMVFWAWIPPLVLLGVLLWFFASRRGAANLSGIPFFCTNHFRHAMFADLLAMQVDHAIALPDGIVLSAAATGSPAMQNAAGALAAHVAGGSDLSVQPDAAKAFPPFLRWLMADGQRQGKLAHALRLAADMYRRRAINRLNWFTTLFPVLACLVIGGGVALLYALGLFLPFIDLLRGLSGPEMRPLD